MMASRASNRGFSVTELLFVLAISATLMAVGTPILREALGEQRLRAGLMDVSTALSEARRQAVRTSVPARIEVDPADGRISVFSLNTVSNAETETRRFNLADGVVFNDLQIITTYSFDPLGRPATLPMTIRLRLVATGQIRTVSVLSTGRINVT